MTHEVLRLKYPKSARTRDRDVVVGISKHEAHLIREGNFSSLTPSDFRKLYRPIGGRVVRVSASSRARSHVRRLAGVAYTED